MLGSCRSIAIDKIEGGYVSNRYDDFGAGPSKPCTPVCSVESAKLAIRSLLAMSEESRVSAFNELQRELADLVRDVCSDPACSPRLVSTERIDPCDYNPNHTADPELDLLETSMREDGVTMPIVVVPDGERVIIVDGFHRHKVGSERLGQRYLPCSFIERPLAERMAATIRHNRARGKHQVELMGVIVRALVREGLDDERICSAIGLSLEELLRLKQTVGAAGMLASKEYGRAWGGRDGEHLADEED